VWRDLVPLLPRTEKLRKSLRREEMTFGETRKSEESSVPRASGTDRGNCPGQKNWLSGTKREKGLKRGTTS